MWVVVMLVIASLTSAAVYWLSLATLPEDDALEERTDRWNHRFATLGIRVDRLSPLVDGLTARLWDLPSRVEHLGGRVEGLRPRLRERARGRGPGGDRAPTGDALAAGEGGAAGASPIVPSAAVAVETAPLTPAPAPEAPPADRPRRTLLPRRSSPRQDEAVAVAPADDPAADDASDPDGVLYVPVLRDPPDAHTRLFGLLGIVVLVLVAGGVLALGVWQSIHLISRMLDGVAGG